MILSAIGFMVENTIWSIFFVIGKSVEFISLLLSPIMPFISAITPANPMMLITIGFMLNALYCMIFLDPPEETSSKTEDNYMQQNFNSLMPLFDMTRLAISAAVAYLLLATGPSIIGSLVAFLDIRPSILVIASIFISSLVIGGIQHFNPQGGKSARIQQPTYTKGTDCSMSSISSTSSSDIDLSSFWETSSEASSTAPDISSFSDTRDDLDVTPSP